jgi:iron only hydrogenase large subunit-like protein
MPCFDKKLEASRKDFYDEETETKEVRILAHSHIINFVLHADSTSR